MKRPLKSRAVCLLCSVTAAAALTVAPGSLFSITAHAHGHRGAHHGYSAQATGNYHCGGYAAHNHNNGVCPYAAPNTWMDDNGCRYYYNSDSRAVTGWQEIDGCRYYFDSAGKMTTGTVTIDGVSCHFNDDGTWDQDWCQSNHPGHHSSYCL